MITRHLPRYYVYLILKGNLSQYVSGPYCYFPRQHALPVLGYPYQMYLQIRLCVCAKLVTSHSDRL